MAAVTASLVLSTIATPPTSVLWAISAETTFTTTRGLPSAVTSRIALSSAVRANSRRGQRMPAPSSR
jgi:hypothetical protein